MDSKYLDCGAFAFLARKAFERSGRVALPVQMIERFNRHACLAWSRRWEGTKGTLPWIFGDFVYHEGVAVVERVGIEPIEVRIWDPTDSVWLEGKNRYGYGALIAVRVHNGIVSDEGPLLWNGIELHSGEWEHVGTATLL